MPDTPGTGAFSTIKEIDPGLPNHEVYRPEKLKAVPRSGMWLVLWGNGSCAADGASSRVHLEEMASRGYLVIAPSTIRSGPEGTDQESQLPPDPNECSWAMISHFAAIPMDPCLQMAGSKRRFASQ